MLALHHFSTLLLCLLAPALNAAGVGSRLPSLTPTAATISTRLRTTQGLSLPQLETYPLLSRLAFSWASDFVLGKRGDNASLTETDIWNIENSAKSMYNISRRFDNARERVLSTNCSDASAVTTSQVEPDSSSRENVVSELWRLPLFRMLVLMYQKELVYTGVLKLLHTMVQFAPPLFISAILRVINEKHILSVHRLKASCLSVGLLIALIMKTILDSHYSYYITSVGGGMRRAVSLAMYKKLLAMKVYNSESVTSGRLANLLSLDAQRIDQLGVALHLLWDGALQSVGYICVLAWFLGPSVMFGVVAMASAVFINMYFLKRLLSARVSNIAQAEDRIRLMNEVFSGIRTVKSYGWESIFDSILSRYRRSELITLSEIMWCRTVVLSIMSALPSLISVLSLGGYAFLGHELTPAKVFTAVSLFNSLKHPLIIYPTVYNTLSDGLVSLKRLSQFLDTPQQNTYIQDENELLISARIQNASFSWSETALPKQDEKKITDIMYIDDLVVKKGDLVVLFGPVGSGKTMLLNALLGELNLVSGQRVSRRSKVAYLPQFPWLPHGSIRSIVLFGNKERFVDWQRYRSVLRSCQLVEDLDSLDYGDFTEIGEHGVTLSGGQRQRLSLARAVYDGSNDLYLFDDPLSALDAEIGRRVFDQCIRGILNKKTRILVSNDLSILPYADKVVVMGRNDTTRSMFIQAQGTYKTLLQQKNVSGVFFEHMMRNVKDLKDPEHECPIVDHETALYPSVVQSDVSVCNESVAVNTTLSEEVDKFQAEDSIDVGRLSNDDTELAPLLIDDSFIPLLSLEERGRGRVKLDVYMYYLRSSESLLLLVLATAAVIVSNIGIQFQQWEVARWAMDQGYGLRSLRGHLAVIASLSVLTGVANFLRTWLFYQSGLRASTSIHQKLLNSALGAPLSFFESTPVGRIMIRFSRDLDHIDHQLPTIVAHFIASVVQTTASVVSIVSVTPMFSALLPPVLFLYYVIANHYVDMMGELKHLEAVSRSPIMCHFTETLSGLSVIRSFQAEQRMIAENERRLNKNSEASFALKVVNRWVGFRLDILGNFLVFFAALLTIIRGSSAGASGISLNNALATTSLLNWVIRNWADTQSLMHSVEKVRQFQYDTPNELPGIVATDLLSNESVLSLVENRSSPCLMNDWPREGSILFSDVSLRYRPNLTPVLKNISFFINPGETVGIVGRTGSGKSSIFRGLLRLTEIESGTIYIDDVNIAEVDVSTLRSRVSIIPQDPVLFSGTVRSNIDPYSTASDADLWEVLQKSHLLKTVEQYPLGLDHKIGEGGKMFSAGQKQLFCMARALVRKSRILLLDEATSSIDPQTDILIQATVRNEFRNRNCTVLTVAHRLKTVLDSDKILVMRDGSVAEHSTPMLLTGDKASLFAQFLEHQEAN